MEKKNLKIDQNVKHGWKRNIKMMIKKKTISKNFDFEKELSNETDRDLLRSLL